MDLLKDQPLLQAINACIDNVDPSSAVDLLHLVSLLLKHTVPEVFLLAPLSTQTAIAKVFRSTIGLGNLAAYLALIISYKKTEENSTQLNAYAHLLDQVFKPNLVRDALSIDTAKKLAYTKDINRLLFRGRMYSLMCQLALINPNMYVPLVFRNMDAYNRFLSKELLVLTDPSIFLNSLFSLSSCLLNQFFDVMLCAENIDFLVALKVTLKRFERKTLIRKFFEYIEFIIPRDTSPEKKIYAFSVVSCQFLDGTVWDELLMENVISRCNHSLNLLAALLIEDPLSMCHALLRSWGSKTLMEKEPITQQEFRTHLLMCLCSQLPQQECKFLTKDENFISAISNRLLAHSNRVKALGIVFSDELSHDAGDSLIFSVDMANEVSVPSLRIRKSSLTCQEAWEVIGEPVVTDVDATHVTSHVQELEKLMEPVIIPGGGGESSDEDDASLSCSKEVTKPLYIRDLLSYLSTDSKEPQAYEKRKIALETAPVLLMQRKGFGSEVSFYAKDLMTQLAALTNFYEEDGFETKKLNAMIALVVSSPPTSAHVCHLLLAGDYSLQQRICLLSTMGLSARELRGYHRDREAQQQSFPTKMLPGNLHGIYLGYEREYAHIERVIQDQVMAQASEIARDEISGGKVLRISAKLTKQKSSVDVTVSKEQLKNFGAMVGKRFFYPLIAVWYESGGISVGHYTPVLIGHYIRTLSLILHSAFPVVADITDMAREYLDLLTPIIQSVAADEIQIVESAVTGVMVVLEVVEDVFLINNFDHRLEIASNAVQRLFDTIIDDKVKSLCAGFMYKVAVLRQNFERSLLDRMNGSLYS